MNDRQTVSLQLLQPRNIACPVEDICERVPNGPLKWCALTDEEGNVELEHLCAMITYEMFSVVGRLETVHLRGLFW